MVGLHSPLDTGSGSLCGNCNSSPFSADAAERSQEAKHDLCSIAFWNCRKYRWINVVGELDFVHWIF